MMAAWARKEYTTKGADPTTVVEWRANGIMIQEFQTVYRIFVDDADWDDEMARKGAESIHKQLEGDFQRSQDELWELQHPQQCPRCGGTFGDNGCVTVGCEV